MMWPTIPTALVDSSRRSPRRGITYLHSLLKYWWCNELHWRGKGIDSMCISLIEWSRTHTAWSSNSTTNYRVVDGLIINYYHSSLCCRRQYVNSERWWRWQRRQWWWWWLALKEVNTGVKLLSLRYRLLMLLLWPESWRVDSIMHDWSGLLGLLLWCTDKWCSQTVCSIDAEREIMGGFYSLT